MDADERSTTAAAAALFRLVLGGEGGPPIIGSSNGEGPLERELRPEKGRLQQKVKKEHAYVYGDGGGEDDSGRR